ncbi:MBL fold metallo-hydrolase [Streptomyces phaeochromogenes]|uniref:MBL fold metallo-hydrolase n=1 Tax=Streptomyces phaeochromogenes TaxID=1923 RepID=UPI00371487E2
MAEEPVVSQIVFPRHAPERPMESGGGMESGERIHYLGHACLVLRTPEGAVVTDPFIRAGRGADERCPQDDLPDFIDLVLLTQRHQDPVVLETMLQLRGRIGAIVAPRSLPEGPDGQGDSGIGRYLSRLGFPVIEADDYDEFAFPGGNVVALPSLYGRCGLDYRVMPVYRVQLAGRSVLIGADPPGVYTWLYHMPLPGTATKEVRNSRTLPDSNADQMVAIMTEFGVGETCVSAKGEEPWPGDVPVAGYEDR